MFTFGSASSVSVASESFVHLKAQGQDGMTGRRRRSRGQLHYKACCVNDATKYQGSMIRDRKEGLLKCHKH